MYERGATYASAWLAQDASVVDDPFASDADPATELLRLVQQASRRGVSLVVCANRGVLEKACEVAARDPSNKRTAWYRALAAASDGKHERNLKLECRHPKPIFPYVDVETTPLDTGSLLLSQTFKKLLQKATDESLWKVCDECAAIEICPFRQNRNWLVQPEATDRLLAALRLAELHSGQIIVFREAIALISLILAGSPVDYSGQSPCVWVRDRTKANAIFALLARRVYMLLFSSYSPFGLEVNQSDCDQQLASLARLAAPPRVSEKTARIIRTLKSSDAKHHISTDVGLPRLLGKQGSFCQLDPVKEKQDKALEEKWTASPNGLLEIEHALVSQLERNCLFVWKELEDGLENYGAESVDAYRALARWITSVTNRLGFFSEGNLLFESELSELEEVIKNEGDDSLERTLHLEEISNQLTKMLSISEDGIEISPFVSIGGGWIRRKMSVEVTGDATGSGGLEARVGRKSFDLSAQVYAWFNRKSTHGLVKETFPTELLQVAKDIRRTAATNSEYAFSKKNVHLYIRLPAESNAIDLRRVGDRVVLPKTFGT